MVRYSGFLHALRDDLYECVSENIRFVGELGLLEKVGKGANVAYQTIRETLLKPQSSWFDVYEVMCRYVIGPENAPPPDSGRMLTFVSAELWDRLPERFSRIDDNLNSGTEPCCLYLRGPNGVFIEYGVERFPGSPETKSASLELKHRSRNSKAVEGVRGELIGMVIGLCNDFSNEEMLYAETG
jgi:hypothetical protein